MIVFGNMAFLESDFSYMEKSYKDPAKTKIIEEMPYVLTVHLKNGDKYGMKYKRENDRNRVFSDITAQIDRFHSNKELFSALAELKQKLHKIEINVENGFSNIRRQFSETQLKAPDIYDRPLAELDLSIRSFNALKRGSYILNLPMETIGDIKNCGFRRLMDFRNLGKKSLQEIKEKMLEKTGEELK